jgi:hypothetical protein
LIGVEDTAVPSLSGVTVAPNPAARGARVRLAFPGTGAGARIAVVDVNGRLARTLTTAGEGVALWDGADEHGVAVRPGLYFVRSLASADPRSVGRVVVLR